MIQGKHTLFVVLVLVMLGLGAMIGYGVGVEKGKQVEDIAQTYTLLPRSHFITSWRANIGGVVAEINPQSITIKDGEKTVWLPLADKIAIEKRLSENKSSYETLTGLSVEDVQVGDRVTAITIANTDGDLTVTKLIILAYQ